MTKREQYPPHDFELDAPRSDGEDKPWEQRAAYEAAYQLARIASALENITENLGSIGRGT